MPPGGVAVAGSPPQTTPARSVATRPPSALPKTIIPPRAPSGHSDRHNPTATHRPPGRSQTAACGQGRPEQRRERSRCDPRAATPGGPGQSLVSGGWRTRARCRAQLVQLADDGDGDADECLQVADRDGDRSV